MKAKLKNLVEKYPFLKIFGSRYILIFIAFVVWMLFFDTYSYLEHQTINKELNELEENKRFYEDEIRRDQSRIKVLQNDDYVEKYAREKYYMKKDSEDIYIIEYEGDTIDSSF